MVGKYGDLLDDFPDGDFVKFCDLRRMFSNELFQVFEAFDICLLAQIILFGFFLLFPQAKDFIGNGIIILAIRSMLNELLLQFVQAFLDTFW